MGIVVIVAINSRVALFWLTCSGLSQSQPHTADKCSGTERESEIVFLCVKDQQGNRAKPATAGPPMDAMARGISLSLGRMFALACQCVRDRERER